MTRILTLEQIKRLREATGLSQDEFARVFSCSRTWYSMIESGHRRITRETSRQLAVAFHVYIQKRIKYLEECGNFATNYL